MKAFRNVLNKQTFKSRLIGKTESIKQTKYFIFEADRTSNCYSDSQII